MAVLLWICALATTALLMAAWREGREAPADRWWSYPVGPAFAEAPQVFEADPGPLLRPSPRPALQTGVAILAVALAIDVSSAPLAQLASVEPQPSAAAASSLWDYTEGHDALAAYAPTSWSLTGGGADGWFV